MAHINKNNYSRDGHVCISPFTHKQTHAHTTSRFPDWAIRRIEDGLSAGDTITFNITANYVVTFFDGTKSIVISTTGSLGGRNPYWGQSMPAIGAVALLLALVLAVSHGLFSCLELPLLTALVMHDAGCTCLRRSLARCALLRGD